MNLMDYYRCTIVDTQMRLVELTARHNHISHKFRAWTSGKPQRVQERLDKLQAEIAGVTAALEHLRAEQLSLSKSG